MKKKIIRGSPRLKEIAAIIEEIKCKTVIRREAGSRRELETWIWEISAKDGAGRAGIDKKIKRYLDDAASSLPIIRRST